MRLRIASDLHCEFHSDHGATLVAELAAGDFDVLVLAGDISDGFGIRDALTRFAKAVKQPLVYVTGNHEYYLSDRASVLAEIRAVVAEYPRLHFLDSDIVTIDGQRFIGTPLWFRHVPSYEAPKWAMSDFSAILDFETWVYEEHRRGQNILFGNLKQGDVLVTHHLPSEKCVAPRYRGNPLNAFFVTDIEALITAREPALAIFGHTHSSFDRQIARTRYLCNPFGYAGSETNPEFRSDLTVEV